ncbi:MAG: permease-like cell division protein FtsX [Flavobacterium sp.]|jgi:cell division transport system permease protein|uniref:cell division protein FtsX n=1 Tax=Flavobacterium TaxID=237 RepID=UPI000C177E9F|nr:MULTISPECIES: permease-like cell division protein FtsX [Flavobacterium]MDI5886834.1 permease-like cell division protein FtsX [Flavobacterium yafengii]MDI6050900.1 permease-like cell division protein FtsX [Flavobacterium sp. XS2P24]MDP3680848.1 permease-like cell division protein FtsX [Flavobacterium sp.]MDZ4331385.1 permease-like cell division protein FtsX [Flavobacterium sp.]PIF61587.1 cell division protein FtsX [Flavobacterium sp. 11]
MSSSFDKFQKRRLISSYFSVVLSVFLVLFLLGVLGLFIINSKKLADDFKENIAMTVFFKNEANDSILKAFGTELKSSRFAKSYDYVTKEAAAKQHTDIIGEDFMEFLGENPLQNSYDIHLKADYVIKDSIAKIETRLRKNAMVSDIVYDKQLVNLVNDNIKKVSMWILVISGFLAVIAVLLINSSLRLSIHSNRFIIKTMQMVGATKAFIRKPFVVRSIKLGMIGAGLAIIALIGVLIYVQTNFPNLGILDDKALIALVLLAVLGIGILITWLSTYFATQRFLNLRTDDLY